MMFTKVVTVYNKYLNPETRLDKFSRTVLRGVFWDEISATTRLQSGLHDADEVTAVIPFSVVSEKQYVSPEEFQKTENKDNVFTFQKGDRILEGNVFFEIESRPSELDKHFTAYTITSVDAKDFGSEHMRHWEVGAN